MPKIYEYFGFVFYFYSNEHEPIHVHVSHDGCETIFELIIQDGELEEIQKRYKKGIEPLNSDDESVAMLFIEEYYKNIIAKWIKFFVWKQKVVCTKITKKLKREK
jgi:hypothetical protein